MARTGKFIRSASLRLCGLLGGAVGGLLLSLVAHHLRTYHGLALPNILLVAFLLISLGLVAGTVRPRYFASFFLFPLYWILNSSESADTEPERMATSRWRYFLGTAGYFFGAPLLVAGSLFSLPWIVAAGVVGILCFAIQLAPRLDLILGSHAGE